MVNERAVIDQLHIKMNSEIYQGRPGIYQEVSCAVFQIQLIENDVLMLNIGLLMALCTKEGSLKLELS